MTNPLSKIQLRPAFEWTCEKCGTDNFERAMIRECTPQEFAEAVESGDVDPDETSDSFEMIAMPIDVKCIRCSTEYEAEYDEDCDSLNSPEDN